MGPNRLEICRLLIDSGSQINMCSYSGSSCLLALCENEDCDPNVVEFLLNHNPSLVNQRRQATTIKWKLIYTLAKCIARCSLKARLLFRYLAEKSGATSLMHAVKRGDLEVVGTCSCSSLSLSLSVFFFI